VDKIIHLYGNASWTTRCGFDVGSTSIANVTSNTEICTCRECLKYMIRDAVQRFVLIDSR
jgi:hypothetical protein